MKRFRRPICIFFGMTLLLEAVAEPAVRERTWTQIPEALKAKIPKLVVVRRKHGYGMNGTNATLFSRRTGMDSSIEIIDPQNPKALPQVLFWTDKGFIWDLDLSWDGTKILFTYKVNNDSPFHLWEMNIDGSNPHQLTHTGLPALL